MKVYRKGQRVVAVEAPDGDSTLIGKHGTVIRSEYGKDPNLPYLVAWDEAGADGVGWGGCEWWSEHESLVKEGNEPKED